MGKPTTVLLPDGFDLTFEQWKAIQDWNCRHHPKWTELGKVKDGMVVRAGWIRNLVGVYSRRRPTPVICPKCGMKCGSEAGLSSHLSRTHRRERPS